MFNNLAGLGYAEDPFQGEPQTYVNLSNLMSRMWASFMHDGNPNGFNLTGYMNWPVYDIVQGGGVGQDYFFDTNTTSHPEADSWRGTGIKYLNSLWKDVYGKYVAVQNSQAELRRWNKSATVIQKPSPFVSVCVIVFVSLYFIPFCCFFRVVLLFDVLS